MCRLCCQALSADCSVSLPGGSGKREWSPPQLCDREQPCAVGTEIVTWSHLVLWFFSPVPTAQMQWPDVTDAGVEALEPAGARLLRAGVSERPVLLGTCVSLGSGTRFRCVVGAQDAHGTRRPWRTYRTDRHVWLPQLHCESAGMCLASPRPRPRPAPSCPRHACPGGPPPEQQPPGASHPRDEQWAWRPLVCQTGGAPFCLVDEAWEVRSAHVCRWGWCQVQKHGRARGSPAPWPPPGLSPVRTACVWPRRASCSCWCPCCAGRHPRSPAAQGLPCPQGRCCTAFGLFCQHLTRGPRCPCCHRLFALNSSVFCNR